MTRKHREEIIRAIQKEYTEMPGLRLYEKQIQKLWSIPAELSAEVLGYLVEFDFLARTESGVYHLSESQRLRHHRKK